MNTVTVYREYGKRGLKAYMRNMWAPTTYVSARRVRERLDNKQRRREWGHSLSRALGSRDYRKLGHLLAAAPPTVAVPDVVSATLRNGDYRPCNYDGTWHHSSDMMYIRREDTWVARCNAEAAGVYQCPTCGHTRAANYNRVRTRDTNITYCSSRCAEMARCTITEEGYWYSDEANAPPIYIYRYNQTFVGPIGTQDSYPLGIEMEIEFPDEDDRHDFAVAVREEYGKDVAHCKHDGSLTSCGVEVITGYGPYADVSSIACKLAHMARVRGGRSHQTDTCGTHISVGRSQMSLAQQARFVVFFNHPDNQSFLKLFARRNSTRYAATVPSKSSDLFITRCEQDFDYLSGDKYEAVNCNHNTHLEVRIFRGSLNTNTILARLSLVRLVSEWCEETRKAHELTYPNFIKWIKRDTDCQMFKSIEQYMKRRGKSELILEGAAC